MKVDENTAAWIETVALGLVAAFLFQSGLLLLLFLVPLQFLWVKRGPNSFYVSGGTALAGIVGVKIVQALRLTAEEVDFVLLFADMLLPVAFVVGLWIMNAQLKWTGTRGVYKLLAAVGAGFLITLPLVVYMARLDIVGIAVEQQLRVLEAMLGGESGGESALAGEEARAFFTALATDVFFGTYVSGIAVVLALDWYLGYRIARRYVERVPDVRRFRMPNTMVWPFIGGLGLSALTMAVGLGVLKYVLWNATLVLGFLYAVQGFAIARHLLDKYRVSRALQLALAVVAVMMVFVPGVNLIPVLGLPGLGLSETWIRYNRGIEER